MSWRHAIRGLLLLGLIEGLPGGFPAAAADQPFPNPRSTVSGEEASTIHIRTKEPEIFDRLSEMYAASSTFRTIVDALDSSDVIVWIGYDFAQVTLALDVQGCTTFMATTPDYRYIRVGLRPGLSRTGLTTILAHELQHVLEIAREPAIVDRASLEDYYNRIGEKRGRSYETEAARLAGWTVTDEVKSSRLRGVSVESTVTSQEAAPESAPVAVVK